MRKGLSPMLASVILIAAALIFIMLGITWIMGVWTTTQETFMITPYLQVSYTTLSEQPVLKIHIVNKGNKADKILKVEIIATGGTFYNDTVTEIPPSTSMTIQIDKWNTTGSPTISAGFRYRIYVYTAEHGKLFYDIVATSSGT
jgi:hypothetical protein